MNDFDEVGYLADYDPDDPTTWPETQRWSIDSDPVADWALAKVRRARWELDRLNDRAEDEKRRIDEWLTDASRPFVRDVEFFERHLIEYRKQVTPAKGKTYRLVNGDLAVKAGSESVEVDEAVFLDWAEGNQRMDLLRTKVEPSKPAIKDAIKAGEEIPGAQIVVGDDRYVVSTGKGEPPAVLPMPRENAA